MKKLLAILIATVTLSSANAVTKSSCADLLATGDQYLDTALRNDSTKNAAIALSVYTRYEICRDKSNKVMFKPNALNSRPGQLDVTSIANPENMKEMMRMFQELTK